MAFVPLKLGLSKILLGLVVTITAINIYSHEIPRETNILAFIKPEGQHLRLLVRVPLEAMRDVNFPLTGPGYLDLANAEESLKEAADLWLGREIIIYENGIILESPQLITASVAIPTDLSFKNYDTALSNTLERKLPSKTEICWQQAMLDVLYEYQITSDSSDFSIRPGVEQLGLQVTTILRFLPINGKALYYQPTGNPGTVILDPHWYHAVLQFTRLGFTHIFDGKDHILFLICLIIPFQRARALFILITAFTIAHSLTLATTTLGLAPNFLWFIPLVETMIALSILYMALENILKPDIHRRWLTVFICGLIHGFGFAYGLKELFPFGGEHALLSLFAFNIGVEIGQLVVIILCLPILRILLKYCTGERVGTILLSILIGHIGWHWMVDRGSTLIEYELSQIIFDGLLWNPFILLTLMILIGLGWFLTRPGRPLG